MAKIEGLLRAVATDPQAPAWGALYLEVCHQGQCYPDGFFLLPHLAGIADGFAAADRDEVLIFAGQIAVDLDDASRSRYAEVLATLHGLTGAWLATPADPQTFIYRIQTVMALEGNRVWGRALEQILDGAEVECPACETSLFIVLGEYGTFATHEDYATMSDVERTPLLPASTDDLKGTGRRLYSMSLDAQQTVVAEALRHIFGHAICTECGSQFGISDQVGLHWQD